MSNNSAENGGIDPRFAQQIIQDGDGPLVQDFLGLAGIGIYVPTPSQNGDSHEIPGQSTIINGEPMSDTQQEAPNSVTPDVLNNPDGDIINRLKDEFAAIAETGAGPGMNEAHGVFLENIYSPQLIPALQAMLDATAASGDIQGTTEVRAAIQAVDSSLNDVRTLSESDKTSLYQAFIDADDLSESGINKFRYAMRTAQDQAIECLGKYRDSITDPLAIHSASEVFGRYTERESGIELPNSFIERLLDPNTKVVMIELDFNSTLNAKESNPIIGLTKPTQNLIGKAVEAFKRHFPDKKIFFNLNTGRPAEYIWGVHEASIRNIPEASGFAFAESGGVIVTNLESCATEVAVENPKQWQRELQGIRDYITSQLGNPNDLTIEPKKSMLSIKVAEKNSPEFILKTKDGKPATPEWIAQQVEDYFLITQSELGVEFDALMEDLEKRFPETHRYILEHLNGNGTNIPLNHGTGQQPEPAANGNGDLRSKRSQVLKTLRTVFNIAETELRGRIDAIDARLDTIDIMHLQGLLQAKYNPTAGYVDVANTHLNKYSSSVRYVCKLEGVKPDQIVWGIIGDSTTDIVPEELTGEGEPNEGAENAFMFVVNNGTPKIKDAATRKGESAMILSNDSLLGVKAVAVGLIKAINSLPAENI